MTRRRPRLHIEGLPIIGVLLVLIAVFMIAAPQVFLGYRIYMSFLATVPPQLILALGLTLVIAAGEIDLSFPSVIAFSGFLFAWAFKTYELTWLALLLALAGGALIGWVNGILVAVIGIPSIIATLATQFFWGGITTVLTGGLSYAIRTIDDYRDPRRPGRPHRRGAGAGAVGDRGRGGLVVRAQPPPLRRAPAVHRRQRRASPAWSASTSGARRSSCSP